MIDYSFSQFNEQSLIFEFFSGETGSFLDIGAAGGVCLSNTFALALAGWSGTLIEPAPHHFLTLLANYNQMHGRVKLINAAVGAASELAKFNYDPSWYSSLIPHPTHPYAAHYWVKTVAPKELKLLQPDCDFLSLDTEGADLFIFPALLDAYPNLRLACVEHGNSPGLRSQWQELLAQRHWEIIGETPENYLAKNLQAKI